MKPKSQGQAYRKKALYFQDKACLKVIGRNEVQNIKFETIGSRYSRMDQVKFVEDSL